MPFLTPFWGEGSPTKIDYRKKGTLIPTSLLEDLVAFPGGKMHGLGLAPRFPLRGIPILCQSRVARRTSSKDPFTFPVFPCWFSRLLDMLISSKGHMGVSFSCGYPS